MIVFGEAKPAGSWVGMPRIIMNRGFIARWTRMPHSTGRLSASASSHHSLSLAAFITNIAESNFRYTQEPIEFAALYSNEFWQMDLGTFTGRGQGGPCLTDAAVANVPLRRNPNDAAAIIAA